MSSELRDERELRAALAVRTPEYNWLPSLTVDLVARRLWDKRQERFVQSVVEATRIAFQELQERIDSADGLTDVAITAARRAGERGNTEYIDTLARLVAAAFLDSARIDTIAYIVDRIVKLEPIHLRLLGPLAEASQSSDDSQNESEDCLYINGRVHVNAAARILDTDVGIVESCLNELVAVGFAERFDAEDKRPAMKARRTSWELTELGISAGKTVNQVRQDLHTGAGSSATA